MPARILVVDDAPQARELVGAVLESEGYIVDAAADGEAALTQVDQATPSLILLDAHMPELNGFEACRRLRAKASLFATPVIFMTGLAASENIVRGFRAGGADYVVKPIEPDALLARIDAHLQRANEQRSADCALTVGGHAALAVDEVGNLYWHSSQAIELLQRYFETEISDTLPDGLRRWFTDSERVARPYPVSQGERWLSVRLVGSDGARGWILKFAELDDHSLIQAFSERFALTPRQAEVLLWIARGKTNPDIARLLNMQPRTVDKHTESIFPQLGVETRAAAAAVALDVMAY